MSRLKGRLNEAVIGVTHVEFDSMSLHTSCVYEIRPRLNFCAPAFSPVGTLYVARLHISLSVLEHFCPSSPTAWPASLCRRGWGRVEGRVETLISLGVGGAGTPRFPAPPLFPSLSHPWCGAGRTVRLSLSHARSGPRPRRRRSRRRSTFGGSMLYCSLQQQDPVRWEPSLLSFARLPADDSKLPTLFLLLAVVTFPSSRSRGSHIYSFLPSVFSSSDAHSSVAPSLPPASEIGSYT